MSKELEALWYLGGFHVLCEGQPEGILCAEDTEEYEIVETALKRLEVIDNSIKPDMKYYEKRSQALEIIKEKRVDIRYLQECESLEQYNEMIEMNWNDRKEAEYNNEILAQEEFDLLKEVLL